MNSKIIKLRGLFSNTKFLIVFSIVIAFIFWIVVALEFSPIVDETIKDVPISVEFDSAALSKYDLQCFGAENFKVDITVEGKRYVVGVLRPDDFIVTASTSYVESSGTKTLILNAVPKDNNADYEVIRLSSEAIEVYFDKLVKNVKIPVEPRIVSSPQKLTEDGLSFDTDKIIISQPTVTVSGAKSQIEKISKVYADISIEKTLSSSMTVDARLNLGDDIQFVEIQDVTKTRDGECVIPAHLCVYKEEEIDVGVDLINKPTGLSNVSYKLNCKSLDFSVLQSKDGVDIPNKISIAEIDYNMISPANSVFSFSAEQISDYISQNKDVDNGIVYDGDFDLFRVEVDTSSLGSKKLAVHESAVIFSDGDKDKYNYDISELSAIETVGPKTDISRITPQNLEAVVEISDVSVGKGSQKVPVTVSVKNNNTCWVYGKYYLTVSLK